MEYTEVKDSIEVPKGTGVEGFVSTIREILSLPRLQNVNIDSRGRITYTYFSRGGERPSLAVDFEALQPFAIARNSTVVELAVTKENASTILGEMFRAASADHLFPVGWIGGAASRFWAWYRSSTGCEPSAGNEELFGVPFYADRHLEDEVLLLCVAYRRGAGLADTQKVYKITIPQEAR